MGAVEAATRKHEAIETDIGAYWERVAAVEAVAKELEAEGYHDVRRVLARRDNVLRLWEYLKELLAARRERLNAHRDLQRLFQEMRYIMDWMADMKVLTLTLKQLFLKYSNCRNLCSTTAFIATFCWLCFQSTKRNFLILSIKLAVFTYVHNSFSVCT